MNTLINLKYCVLEINAFDANDELSPLGKLLARLPIDPRMGKMLVLSCFFEYAV